ncbi:MAG: metallophosphoesterase, partial [Chloroflexi bacterium]|nr:metallophosphoesterase [Chloroflexota bacterium]
MKVGLAASAAVCSTGGYAVGIEPHWVEIVNRDLPIARLPQALLGKRLVQISDLHVGSRVPDDYLIHCLDLVRALAPDILVMTGDFVSYQDTGQIDQLRAVLRHLPLGNLGTFAILGNHDYGRGWSRAEVALQVTQELNRAGVAMLRNEVAQVQGLQIAGLDDIWSRHFQPEVVFSRLDRASASIALVHNPDGVDDPGFGEYAGWVLAGHTHGGQCKPPF